MLRDHIAPNATTVCKLLQEKGVGTRPFFWPMLEQPVFLKKGMFRDESYSVAERLTRRGFYLPSGLALTEDQAIRVSEELRLQLEVL